MLVSFLLFFKIIIIWILIILQRWTISRSWVLWWANRATHSWCVSTHPSDYPYCCSNHISGQWKPLHVGSWTLTTWNIDTSPDIWFQISKMLPDLSFYNSCIRPRISPFPTIVASFDGKGYIKTTIWVLGIIISTRLVIVSRPFQRTEIVGLVYLCVYPHTHPYIFKYISGIHTDTSKSNAELNSFYHLLFCISNFSSSENTPLL